jgi:hypothetical protein
VRKYGTDYMGNYCFVRIANFYAFIVDYMRAFRGWVSSTLRSWSFESKFEAAEAAGVSLAVVGIGNVASVSLFPSLASFLLRLWPVSVSGLASVSGRVPVSISGPVGASGLISKSGLKSAFDSVFVFCRASNKGYPPWSRRSSEGEIGAVS